ncbi:MAG: (d)CMP kinase [Rhodospirillaceae bacterium]
MRPARQVVIAIDGPAASGKGTLARKLAAHFGLRHLDTGSLYRAVGLSILKAGQDPADEDHAVAAVKSLDLGKFDPAELRSEAAGIAASQVASLPSVRAELLDFQRKFAVTPDSGFRGAILDGRDIGSVVCADSADIKIFVEANLEVRITRRIKELQDRGESFNERQVRTDMESRDARDRDRSISPLKPAADARRLDTTGLNADEAFASALALIYENGIF